MINDLYFVLVVRKETVENLVLLFRDNILWLKSFEQVYSFGVALEPAQDPK